jgi:glucokinase
MLLAGDIGGTKTFMGLFERAGDRPRAMAVRSYRTLDFADLGALSRQFLIDAGVKATHVESAAFGVAGPVRGRRAQLTNVPWVVDVEMLARDLPVPQAHLLNDLEALAWSVPVLSGGEIAVLREGEIDPLGNAALIAAGTGLGVAILPNVNGRLVPRASEGGHADFAARNADERALQDALALEYGRTDIERVVSGPGLANIHRILSDHQCPGLTPLPAVDALPAAISRAALDDGCPQCIRTLEVFVSAYGAAAGNLAVTVLATGGIYLGGGIAPRILTALRWPTFIDAFLAKSPMDLLIARIPVKVILNPEAGLIGAAVYLNRI